MPHSVHARCFRPTTAKHRVMSRSCTDCRVRGSASRHSTIFPAWTMGGESVRSPHRATRSRSTLTSTIDIMSFLGGTGMRQARSHIISKAAASPRGGFGTWKGGGACMESWSSSDTASSAAILTAAASFSLHIVIGAHSASSLQLDSNQRDPMRIFSKNACCTSFKAARLSAV